MLERMDWWKVIDYGMTHKCKFVDVFCENSYSYLLSCVNGRRNIERREIQGVGIRFVKNDRVYYAHTNIISERKIYELMKRLFEEDFSRSKWHSISAYSDIYSFGIQKSDEIDFEKHFFNLDLIVCSIKESKNIKLAGAEVFSKEQHVEIHNSKNQSVFDDRRKIRYTAKAIVGKSNMTQACSRSRNDIKLNNSLIDLGKTVGEKANEYLNADRCEAGVYPVVLDKGSCGIVFHEACGHALEASNVKKGSVFANKIGESIASDKITFIDDGSYKNGWGTSNFDDEGSKTRKSVLIRNGILNGYLTDYSCAVDLDMDVTGLEI